MKDPEGSISSKDLLRDEEEETFLLLRPEHVDRMLGSLTDHRDDLLVMGSADIAELERWTDQCRADMGRMIAYVFS